MRNAWRLLRAYVGMQEDFDCPYECKVLILFTPPGNVLAIHDECAACME